MKKIVFAIMMAALMHTASWAQDVDVKETIKENLSQSVSDLEEAEAKLDKAMQQLEQANKSQKDVDKMKADAAKLKKSKQKKALKEAEAKEAPILTKKIAAYTMMEKAQKSIYDIYKADIEDKLVDVPDSKLDKVSELLEETENCWTRAEAAANSIPTDKKASPQSVVKAHEKYASYQTEAIDKQVENLTMILGIFDKPEPKAVEEDIPEVDEMPKTPAVQPDRIHYKVQIAADVTPLTLEFLQKKVYNTTEVINNEYTDGTYRYLVGRYDTYEEAKAAKIRMKVKGAFVVKYKNGKRQQDIKDDSDNY